MGSIRENVALAEMMARLWKADEPGSSPNVSDFGRIKIVSLASEIEGMWIWHWIEIGSRGRIDEKLTVMIPDLVPTADQIICCIRLKPWDHASCLTAYAGTFRSMEEGKKLALVSTKMKDYADHLRSNTKVWLLNHFHYLGSLYSEGGSITTLPGCYGTSPRR